MRNFKPDKSAGSFSSLRNQPPIWQPVLPAGMLYTLNFLKNSFSRSMPPADIIQAFCMRALRPNGTAVPNANVGSLPV